MELFLDLLGLVFAAGIGALLVIIWQTGASTTQKLLMGGVFVVPLVLGVIYAHSSDGHDCVEWDYGPDGRAEDCLTYADELPEEP
jgi:hypothetical protein